MALKTDRIHIDSRIDYFMTHTASRGGVAVVQNAGSGAAMDQAAQRVEYATAPSGTNPIGVLMCDVVNLDLARQKMNVHKEEVQQGGKVTLWTKCQVTTDYLASGITVTAGQPAYLGAEGRITNVDSGAEASPRVGRFESRLDEAGFAKVSINLP
jgi:hypothetical protein